MPLLRGSFYLLENGVKVLLPPRTRPNLRDLLRSPSLRSMDLNLVCLILRGIYLAIGNSVQHKFVLWGHLIKYKLNSWKPEDEEGDS